MNLAQLEDEIQRLLGIIESKTNGIEGVSSTLQAQAYKIIKEEFLKFPQADGHFIADKSMRTRLIAIDDKVREIFKLSIWDKSINEFLPVFQTIQDMNVQMQYDYNKLKVAVQDLNPSRQYIYQQAKYALTTAVAPQYVEPITTVLMQQVTGGASIQQGLAMLEKWNEGKLSDGRYTNKIMAPNLQKYATQIARDSAYSLDRTINSVIKDRHDLDKFIYVGGVISDSRPLCRYLVSLHRKIAFDELPPLFELYPDGLIEGTNRQNFTIRCGGYNCRHRAMAVR